MTKEAETRPGHDARQHRIRKPKASARVCAPHILPCRVHHDGPVNATSRYWSPEQGKDHATAYFRGRRLLGRKIELPAGYTGALLRKSAAVEKDASLKTQAMDELEAKRATMDPQDYMAEEEDLRAAIRRGELDGDEVQLVDEVGAFDGLTVWGHDRVPDAADEPFVRGVEEWIALAAAIHTPRD